MLVLFFEVINLFINERQRERERDRQRHKQREKQAPCKEPNAGLDPGSPGSHPGLKEVLNPWATRAAHRACSYDCLHGGKYQAQVWLWEIVDHHQETCQRQTWWLCWVKCWVWLWTVSLKMRLPQVFWAISVVKHRGTLGWSPSCLWSYLRTWSLCH